MAFYDDARRLLKQIRHSFVTGDESQLCEHVLLNNDFPLPKGPYDSDDDLVIDDEHVTAVLAESPDLFVGTGPHRPRTYTAIRLEKIRKEKDSSSKIRHVQWCASSKASSETDLEDMFARKPVPLEPKKSASKLSQLLDASPLLPTNPFVKYARFDGAHAVPDVAVKHLKIFFHLIDDDVSPPIQLQVLASATVSDVIGLACWMFTDKFAGRSLPFHDVDSYQLLFAEEDGEYDFDFPALDKSETIAKFHFTSLALVPEASKMFSVSGSDSAEKKTEEIVRVTILPSKEVVDVVLPPETAGEVTVSNLISLTIEQCQSPLLANRIRNKTYVMRDKADPNNVILSLSTKILENCSRDLILAPSETRAEEIRMRKHLSVMEASLYESFIVSLVQKIGTAEIHLGISGDKIEVNPVVKGLRLGILPTRVQVKPATYHIDSIADCSIVDEKYGKKAVVRLVHKSPSGTFKNLDFECDRDTARTIDQKCKHILNFRGSVVRQEFQETDVNFKRVSKK